MTPRKKIRPPLDHSIEDLWNGNTSQKVKEKLAASEKALKEQEHGKEVEAGRPVQEE